MKRDIGGERKRSGGGKEGGLVEEEGEERGERGGLFNLRFVLAYTTAVTRPVVQDQKTFIGGGGNINLN